MADSFKKDEKKTGASKKIQARGTLVDKKSLISSTGGRPRKNPEEKVTKRVTVYVTELEKAYIKKKAGLVNEGTLCRQHLLDTGFIPNKSELEKFKKREGL